MKPRLTRPLATSSSTTRPTVETGMASSSWRRSPDVLMPTTRPCASISGPPETAGDSRRPGPQHRAEAPPRPELPGPAEGAHDAPAHARPVPHRQHDVADLQRAGLAERRRGEVGVADPEHGQIGAGVTADKTR